MLIKYAIATQPIPVPAGVVPGALYRITLTNEAGNASVFDVSALEGEIDLADGTYSGTVQALDASSVPFGVIASGGPITVSAPTYAAPAALVFTL